MFARALIVLLVVLNLGVAGWWAWRAPPAGPPAPEAPPDAPRLRLVGEAADPQSTPDSATRRVAQMPATPVPLPADAVCHSLGPFADRAAVQDAQALLGERVLQALVRERPAGPVRAWRVIVPPLPTAEQAAALAGRIAAAGFSDYFVMREGADTNAIALGRFRGEGSARRREAELVAAGFAARAEPVGAGPLQFWLDVAAAPGFDAVAARAVIAAPEQRPLDCAAMTASPVAVE